MYRKKITRIITNIIIRALIHFFILCNNFLLSAFRPNISEVPAPHKSISRLSVITFRVPIESEEFTVWIQDIYLTEGSAVFRQFCCASALVLSTYFSYQ